jgi:hypothetical protein
MKLNNETVAEMIYSAAYERFNKAHKAWSKDAKMMQVMTDDYLDLIKIAHLVDSDELNKATKAMFNLDTEVRDDIPEKAYNWLMENR